MENALTLKVYKMNYEFLVKNYLDRKMWEREWTLFEYGPYKVTINIWSIFTRTEQIAFDIKLHYSDERRRWDYKEKTVNFSLKIDNISFLKRQINSAIYELIKSVERDTKITQTPEYLELEVVRQNETKQLTEIAENFLDKCQVTNSNLRETYIEAYVDEYSKIPETICDYVQNRMYKELPDLYLTWLFCLEDDPKKESRIKEVEEALSNERYNEIIKEIEEYQKYMETEEYIDEMESNLEEV